MRLSIWTRFKISCRADRLGNRRAGAIVRMRPANLNKNQTRRPGNLLSKMTLKLAMMKGPLPQMAQVLTEMTHPVTTHKSRRYFGTDGIRGRVGVWPITPEFVLKLGWAVGKVLARQGTGKVLIGKDTRISGYMFGSVLESGLSAAGIDTHLLGPMPTPAIAYLTRTLRAQAGIVISASHIPTMIMASNSFLPR